MRVTLYANLEKKYLLDAGEKAGLEGDALEFFSFFNEIEIDLFVDAENGAVTGAEITQKF